MSYLKHKPGSIEEMMANQAKKLNDSAYQDMFKKELEKAGKGIGAMTPAEKKAFFNKIDDKYKAKNEAVDNPYAVGMAAAMKKTGDKPPLKKSTITKAHDIAKSIEKDQKKEVKESDAYDNNRYMMKKYGGQILARPDNSNTKDGKDHVYAPNAQIAKQLYKQGKKVYREESDHEVSMARGELEAIADKENQLAGALQGKSDEGNPLEAWVQSKITKAKDYINSVSDYLTYDPSMKQNEEVELQEFKKMTVTIADPIKRKKAMDDVSKALNVPGCKGFTLQRLGSRSFKVDGKGADLNKFATDLKNFYNATVKAESIEEENLEEKFALYALRDFTDTRAPGGMRKKGDRASGPMTYTQAIKKAKQMNAGSSIGGSKDVEVRPMKEELEEAKIISDISGVSINVIKKEVIPFNVKVGRVGPGMDSDY